MPPAIADPKRDAEIAELRASGMSLAEIGERYGISRERVRQIAGRTGIAPKDANKIAAQRRMQERMTLLNSRLDEASKYSTVILMRWIAGEEIASIARSLGISTKLAQAVLEEDITDDVVAARANFRFGKVGPRSETMIRTDRHWTAQRVRDVLVNLAAENGGRLMTSTAYDKLSRERKDLPSFATVRNRLGRWSSVVADINANGRQT